DDGPSYAADPANFLGTVVIEDGTINGTSTGIRAGENGKNVGGPAVSVDNVVITNAVTAEIDNQTQSTMTVTGTDDADTYEAIATSTGKFVLNGGDDSDVLSGGAGNDTFTGGAGADTLNGNGGTDKAVYTGSITQNMVTASLGGWSVASGGEGTDTLSDI